MYTAIMYYGDNYILVNEKTGRFYESVELPKHPSFKLGKELSSQFVLNFYKTRLEDKEDPLWDWERKECERLLK